MFCASPVAVPKFPLLSVTTAGSESSSIDSVGLQPTEHPDNEPAWHNQSTELAVDAMCTFIYIYVFNSEACPPESD